MCVFSSLGGPPRPPSVFFHFIFRRSNSSQNRRVIVLPQRSATAESLPKYPPHPWYCFRLVVALVWLGAAAQGRGPVPLSLFFVAPFAAQDDRKRFSQRVPPRSRLMKLPPPPPQPTFGWLMCLLTKRRPPKVAALPISQFFDGCPFGAQNKGKESDENGLRPLAPTQELWGATAP